MDEKKLTEEVLAFSQEITKSYLKQTNPDGKKNFPRIRVESARIYTGSVPWWESKRDWKWKHFKRQVDVVIGIDAIIDEEDELIPLIAIELKAGKNLNTDELDKKGAIYGPLRELYPWVHTVFMHADMRERNMDPVYLLRNGRHFNTIYTEWDQVTKDLFRKLVYQQLEYLLEYWEL